MGVAARTFASSAAVIGASSLAVEPRASPIDYRRSGSSVRLDPRTARVSASRDRQPAGTVSTPAARSSSRAAALEAGATPATRSVSTRTHAPVAAASRAEARTQ